ncbi:hypothetical protein GFS60_06492 (plasmid) [Rhodococcus sp. WAY2]|nr:hypothetical protein GFS60_06492 [Rhodococcus sp. WAY2]
MLVGGRLYAAEVRGSVFTEHPDSLLCDAPFIALLREENPSLRS